MKKIFPAECFAYLTHHTAKEKCDFAQFCEVKVFIMKAVVTSQFPETAELLNEIVDF